MRFIKIIILVIVICTLYHNSAAQKVEAFYVNNKSEINNINKFVIYTKGDDKALDNILQDALGTKFKVYGWKVIDRGQLESEVNKDYQAKQKQVLKDSSDIIPLSIDQMTDLVKAQHYMIIDYTVSKKQYSNPVSKTGNEGTEKIVISSLSFRILKVGNYEPIAVGVLDFLLGQSPTYAAEDIKLLIDKMK